MRIEPLEARIAPAAFIVTNVHDSGPGSLRDAITQANLAHMDTSDTISFAAGVHGKIVLKSALPAIVDDVPLTITGRGQRSWPSMAAASSRSSISATARRRGP